MNTITTTNTELVTSSAAEEARKLRDELIGQAQACMVVKDQPSQLAATETLRSLRDFYKTIVNGKDAAKAPVLKIEREIDSLFHDLADEVKSEGERLGAILGSYDIEQKRLAEVARQEAAREERRIREEAAAKERAEAERQEKLAAQARAEVARQQAAIKAEADAKAARARTEAGRERAAKGAEAAALRLAEQAKQDAIEAEAKAQREAKARFEEEARKVAETRSAAVAIAAKKPKGTATREDIKFEVLDIAALYEAAPYLVTLSPNNQGIKAALGNLRPDQSLPGIKWWKEASTITRG